MDNIAVVGGKTFKLTQMEDAENYVVVAGVKYKVEEMPEEKTEETKTDAPEQ